MPQCTKMAIMIQKFENGKFLNFDIFLLQSCFTVRNGKKVPTKKLVWGMGMSEGAEWYQIDHK